MRPRRACSVGAGWDLRSVLHELPSPKHPLLLSRHLSYLVCHVLVHFVSTIRVILHLCLLLLVDLDDACVLHGVGVVQEHLRVVLSDLALQLDLVLGVLHGGGELLLRELDDLLLGGQLPLTLKLLVVLILHQLLHSLLASLPLDVLLHAEVRSLAPLHDFQCFLPGFLLGLLLLLPLHVPPQLGFQRLERTNFVLRGLHLAMEVFHVRRRGE
mmetsp:Transcript_103292/g.296540  ORF Transcript_103292/g.296540 Transcript_103292/m.296540 type:complete len:213 (-) Transcript_103292:303-941(-)